MRIAVLGPVEVRATDGTAIDVRGGRLRALVARLALDAGRPVGVNTLVDALWGDDPPAAAHNALQSPVSRLRTALGSTDAVLSGPAGYTLAGAEVDATEFERLVGRARSCRPDEAVALLDRALGCGAATRSPTSGTRRSHRAPRPGSTTCCSPPPRTGRST